MIALPIFNPPGYPFFSAFLHYAAIPKSSYIGISGRAVLDQTAEILIQQTKVGWEFCMVTKFLGD